MSIKVFCDVHKGEITGTNVGKEDWIVEVGDFSARVTVDKCGADNDGDLCLDCLLKMLNQKPKRKYERKPKAEEIKVITPELQEMEEGLNSEGLTLLKPAKKRSKKTIPGKPDISTFTIKTPAPSSSNPHYTLSLEGVGVACLTLKEGVKEMLTLSGIDQAYVEDAPESEGKRNLLDIIKFEPNASRGIRG